MTATLDLTRPSDLGPLYQDYAYGYPHKNAYRNLNTPKRLRDAWEMENKNNVFLYVHIPFCEMRCGFCNLFTTANPREDYVERYLQTLVQSCEVARDEIGTMNVARIAIGGGTPTFLSATALAQLFDGIADNFGVNPLSIPTAIETSPKTATEDRLKLLLQRGVQRISIGVQSFIEDETRVMGRPQAPGTAEAALDTIRKFDFKKLNIDLIYGAANQTVSSWQSSLRRALEWTPEDIYLYPLYIRCLTGIDGRANVEDEHRRTLYRAGRDLLLENGYDQISMRAFRRTDTIAEASDEYSCQEDGMLGLGAGARSYTKRLHYSTDYAVKRAGVLGIIDQYIAQSDNHLRHIHHGIEISKNERTRRFVLKSILNADGLNTDRFFDLFGASTETLFPQIAQLTAMNLLTQTENHIRPTALGLEHSDAIPPLFYSADVRQRLQTANLT